MLDADSPNSAGRFSPLTAGEIETARKAKGASGWQDDGAVCLLPVPRDAPRPPDPRDPVGTWTYCDASGALMFRTHRFDDPGGEKRFSWQTAWRLSNGHIVWRWKAPPTPRPLYGLDRLAARTHAPVIVTEGERDAEAAQRLFTGAVTITSPGGSQAAEKADWSPLRGRLVLIWRDADTPGEAYAKSVAGLLDGVAAEIKMVDAVALASIDPAGGIREPELGWGAADAEKDWRGRHDELRQAIKRLAMPHVASAALTANEAAPIRVADGAQASWRTPQPLPSGLLPVPAFDLAYLPEAVAPWVGDIADRMQCPADFVAIPAIVALGSVLGRKVAIRPQARTDWFEVPNLWGCVVGRPGAMKSPALTEALKPLQRLEGKARVDNDAALRVYEKEQALAKVKKEEAAKAARAALKAGDDPSDAFDIDEPEEPKAKRLLVNDTSYEALGEILADNPNGVLASRDELVSLLRTLDREEYAAARGFFLTAWNGTSGYTFDRITRGQKHIEAACLSLIGGTQPGRLAEYIRRAVSGGAGDDGLIQRFGLLVWPDQSPEWKEVDRWPDSEARATAWKAFDTFDTCSPEAFGAERGDFDSLPFLRFDAAAQGVFGEWRAALESRLRGGDLSSALESHFSKYRKLVPALALINHLADGGHGPVSEKPTLRALAFAEFLEAHARRAYGAGSESETATAKAILARIRAGDLQNGFTLRDAMRAHWTGLTDRDQVKAGLDLLNDLDWLAGKTEQTGGRPRTFYTINPRMEA